MADGLVDGPTQAAPISVIGAPPNANPEGEMDALLLGRTRVSYVFGKILHIDVCIITNI